MSFAKIFRSSACASLATMALLGTGCATQQAAAPQATPSASSAQILPPGPVNFGQATYVMPVLPSANEASYALSGKETPHPWQQPQGSWIGGINGTVYIQPTP